jgi:hypothetical protein
VPCYDSRNEPAYVRAEARKEWRHNSDVAQMLCTILKECRPETIATLPEEIQQWWAEHQARDQNV